MNKVSKIKRPLSFIFVLFLSQFLFSHTALPIEKTTISKHDCPDLTYASALSPREKYEIAKAYNIAPCNTDKNQKTSKQLYTESANDGYAPAQHWLGEFYFTGKEDTPNYIKAKEWYLKAANQGYGTSQLRLGFLYAEAHFEGLSVDYDEAEKWFLKAAEQNSGDAQFRLGNFYRNYKNPPDKEKTLFWLSKAAEGGHRIAMFDLANIQKDKNNTDEYLKWMSKAAENDVIPALFTMSEIYSQGKIVPKNLEKSHDYLKKAAQKGSFRAKMLLKGYANDNEESPKE